jgi:hypothetical protein
MLRYVDALSSIVVGGLPEDTSAEVKFDTAQRRAAEALEHVEKAYPDLEFGDPNAAGMARAVDRIKVVLDNTTAEKTSLEAKLANLQKRFDESTAATIEKEKALLAEKDKYEKQVEEIQADYEELEDVLKKSNDERVQTIMVRWNEEKEHRQQLRRDLRKTEAQLRVAEKRIELLSSEIAETKPPPDSYVPAFKPDGKIILIDDQAGIVHLNIGRDDRVYRGLTFSVYDKNTPIPRDGRGKAEIEVFDFGKNFASARVIEGTRKRPIVLDDIVANLIWDASDANVFVVAGDFDLDGDGRKDTEARDKLVALISKWGGRPADAVSPQTDFLLIGEAPVVPPKPTLDDLDLDPNADDRYRSAQERLVRYREVLMMAESLSVPVFNLDRFLDFVGCRSQVNRPGFL